MSHAALGRGTDDTSRVLLALGQQVSSLVRRDPWGLCIGHARCAALLVVLQCASAQSRGISVDVCVCQYVNVCVC